MGDEKYPHLEELAGEYALKIANAGYENLADLLYDLALEAYELDRRGAHRRP